MLCIFFGPFTSYIYNQIKNNNNINRIWFYLKNIIYYTLPLAIASGSLSFQCCATSFAKGSSGFGAERSACMERSTVRICKAGDHLSDKIVWNEMKSYYWSNLKVQIKFFLN